MQQSPPAFKKYLFVCENTREAGSVCCGAAGSRIEEVLKKAVQDGGLSAKISITSSGCQNVCKDGPNVLLMPDNIWFKRVSEKDLGAILRRAMESA